MPTRTDFQVFRGVAFPIVGNPLTVQDITGWKLQFVLGPSNQPAFPPPEPVLILDNFDVGGVSIPDGPAGTWRVDFTNAMSLALLNVGTFPWSVCRVDVGFEDVLAYGNLVFLQTNKW